jgi:hypothetical protein
VETPVYCFSTHQRLPGQSQILKAQPLLIFEGIMALYERRFRDLMDLKIFVLTDDDIRLARRIKRDIAARGRTIEDVLAQYNRFVKTSYDEFIKPTMKYADIIVPRGRSNTKAIDFVVSNLKVRVPMEHLNDNFSDGVSGLSALGDVKIADGTKKGAAITLSSTKKRKLDKLLTMLQPMPPAAQLCDELILIDSLLGLAG